MIAFNLREGRASPKLHLLPGDLEAQIEAFVDHLNHQHYHQRLNNVTPADVYIGWNKAI